MALSAAPMITLPLWKLAALFASGLGAGFLGAWVGIGGGVVLVPLLVLGFGIDPKIAIATSLLTVIGTSTAAGSVYVGRGMTNTRLAIALEIATSIGGITGGLLAIVVPSDALAGIFALVMGATSALMLRNARTREVGELTPSDTPTEGTEEAGVLAGTYYDLTRKGVVHYRVTRFAGGSLIALLAGAVSGMLGVGGGFLKVPAMNLAMDVPMKVAVATSNFMIGVTAASSVFVYFGRGYVHPLLVAPIVLGVVAGALAGTAYSGRASHAAIKRVLAIVLIVVAVQMALRALGVHLVS
jgi:hypothetical protein